MVFYNNIIYGEHKKNSFFLLPEVAISEDGIELEQSQPAN